MKIILAVRRFLTIRTMSRTIEYNSSNDEPAYKQFRLTIGNDVLVTAIEDIQRQTGMSEREIAKEAIVSYLEDKEQIKLQ